MAEKNNRLSLTFRVDAGVLGHNNREFIAKNVDRERVSENITYKQENIREKYHELFDKALEEYNAKMRSNRRIKDYYEHMNKSQKEKPFYEIVVQVGDKDNCGIGAENFESAKQMLDEYMKAFEKRNPNIKVFNAVMHLDEATPHLHIDFVPICHNRTRGLSTKTSLKGALEEQGFSSKSKRISEWASWAESEKQMLAEVLKKHGFSQDVKGAHYSHMTVPEYKNAKKKIEEINKHVNAFKEKPIENLSPEEIAMIKNQNDYLRGEIQKRDENIKILSKKAGAKYVQYEIYAPDKLAFVAEELKRANVPLVEESNAIYIPDWAYKTAAAIAAKYQYPPKSSGIHEEIKLDIDTLIYSCENFSQLLDKLREKNYVLKTEGKYIAVKSPAAQRFVRLKTLGEEYLPQNIEKRIAEREIFPKAVQAKSAKANETEQRFYATITQTIIAVRTFKFRPQKTNPKKIYSFQNDKQIDFLSQQLLTMRDFSLTEPDEFYKTAEESQKKIAEKIEKIKQLSESIPQIKSDISQLKFYFSSANFKNIDAMTRTKIAAAKEVADKYGFASAEDIKSLETRLRLTPTYIGTIKSEISDEQLKLNRVSELIRTYEKIIKGNYIDNLIAAERERKARDESQMRKK